MDATTVQTVLWSALAGALLLGSAWRLAQRRAVAAEAVSNDLRRSEQSLHAAVEQLQRQSRQLAQLSRAGVLASAKVAQPDLLQTLVDQLRLIVGAHQAVLSLTTDTQWAQSINAVSLSDKYAQWRNYQGAPDGSGIYALICEHNQALRMSQGELEAHPRWRGFGAHAQHHPPMRGWLAVPLNDNTGAAIGLLQLSDKFDGEFSEHDQSIAEQFAQMVSAKLEQASLIADLRNALARLGEREALLTAAERIAHMGSWELDVHFDTELRKGEVRWSDEMFRLLGYEVGKVGASSEGFYARVHPDDRQRVQAAVDEALAQARGFSVDHRIVLPDGSERIVALNGMLHHDAHSRPLRMLGTLTDITERRRIELALEHSFGDLQERNKELQDFAFIASHDLQEPLRKVLAFGDRLRNHSAASLDERGRDYLGRMVGAAERMRGLIDDLLSYFRVSAQSRPALPVDLNRAVREVLLDLETRIESCGALIGVEDLPTLMADPTQMRQLFQNLLANALKFCASDRAPAIRVWSERLAATATEAQRVRIVVEDNGIGFDNQQRERIFAPFQRLRGRSEYAGTGIGLAIARKIVERHGGSISAEGRPDLGARFVIVLPLSLTQPGPPAAAGALTQRSGAVSING